MLSASISINATRPLLKFNTHFSPRRPLLHRHSLSSSTPIRMSSSTATTTLVEHIVLFNVKPGSDTSAMLSGLNSLRSLDVVHHLTAGPLLRSRSSSLSFTHLLHSRYRSKDDLAAYAAHPAHVDVVKSSVPICQDTMAVDWVASVPESGSVPKPGSAIRVQFAKLKEGLGEREKAEVMDVIGGLKEKVSGIEQLTFGENFSPGRAKGFTIASIGIFSGVQELDAVDQNEEIAKEKDKVRDYIDSLVVVDYVVPNSDHSANL